MTIKKKKFSIRSLNAAEAPTMTSKRKGALVSSFTLTGGSFRGGAVVIDKNRRGRSSRPALSARAQSLPTSVGAAASVNSDEASVGPAVLEQIKPDDVVLEEMVAQLGAEEKEIAARSSYQYSKLSDAITNRGERMDRIRDRAAMGMAVRHWIAEKGDTAKALKQLRKTIQYRADKQAVEIRKCFDEDTPQAIELRSKVAHYLGQEGRMFVRGYDLEGRACFHFICRNSPAYSKTDPDGCIEAHFYVLEKALACTERRTFGKVGTVIVSVDFNNFIKRHAPPMNMIKEMLAMLKDHYPERLHRVYLVDAPVVFRALWSLIKPFVDPVTKTKFQFVTGEKQRMQVFGETMEAGECMSYQRSDGIMVEQIDMDKFYGLAYEMAYDEL